MDVRHSLSETFWQDFVGDAWEKHTTHLQFALPISEDDLFAGMLQAADVERATWPSNFNDPYRVALDGCHVLDAETLAAFLPVEEDEDMDGYIQRMEAMCDLDMAVQVTKITSHSFTIWQRVRQFLQPLFAAVGVIPETIEIDLFMGKYQQTHFGVHLDSESTFTFGFRGQKQFRMWPRETFTPEMAIDGWPTNIQDDYYQEYRDQAEVVTTGPGVMLYWPSSVWHVGESSHSWSITLAVALHLKPDPYERVKDILSRFLPNPLQTVNPNAYTCDVKNYSNQTPPLAENLAIALQHIRQSVDEEVIDLNLSLDWLKQASGCGLTATPPPSESTGFVEGQTFCLDTRFPILWKAFPQNRMVIAANGYGAIFEDVDAQQLSPILLRLNQGGTVALSKLESPALRTVFQGLAGWHVFVNPSS